MASEPPATPPSRRRQPTSPAPGGGLSVPRRVGLGVVLSLGMMVATFLVPVISVLSRFLIEEFSLSRAQVGSLITVMTGVAAALSPASGRLVDRLRSRASLALMFALGTVVMASVAAAPTYLVLLVCAASAGVADALGNPSTNKVLVLHIPPGRRGLLMGIKQSGVEVGSFLAGMTLPVIAFAMGWRTAALAAAVPAALGVVLVLWLLPPDPASRHVSGPDEEPYRHPVAVRSLAVYGFLMGAAHAAIIAFLPLYAQEAVGLSVAAAGAALSLVGLLGIAARIAWSRLSEHRRHYAFPLGMMAALSVAATAVLWQSAALGAAAFWVGTVGIGLTVGAWLGVGMLAAVTAVDVRHAGRATGLVLMGFLAGFAASPMIFGLSVDATGSYGPGWLAVVVMLGAPVAVTVVWCRATSPLTPAEAGGGGDRDPISARQRSQEEER